MFETSIFKKETIQFTVAPDPTSEDILRGGRDKFPLVKEALKDVKQIGVIGWGSQAPAQAQNLKDTLAEIGHDCKVTIGLRKGSPSWQAAEAVGFSVADGTLAEQFEVTKNADLVMLLISDAAQVLGHKLVRVRCRGSVQPGKYIWEPMLSHKEKGFWSTLGSGNSEPHAFRGQNP